MKKAVILVLALAMVFLFSAVALAAGLGNFTYRNTYQAGQFGDVDETAWYAENVATAFELGLMKGTGANFNVGGNMSIAETIAIAARIHSIYNTGSESFTQGSPWYQIYVDYALRSGIIKSAYPDYNKAATRADFAVILGNSLPDSALPAINTITDNEIPDVPMTATFATMVYKLYRAGVLTGNDAQGTFTPNASINRCAAAAIVTRMVDPTLRKTVNLGSEYTITASQTNLSLGVGESTTVYLTYTGGGYLTSDTETDVVASSEWTAYGPGTASLTITGLQDGFTWIKVDHSNSDAYIYIGVTVEANSTLTASEDQIYLGVGQSTTVYITTTVNFLAFDIETDGIASAEWTDFGSLKITGLQGGFTWIRVFNDDLDLSDYVGVTVTPAPTPPPIQEPYLNASQTYVSLNVGQSTTIYLTTNVTGAILAFDPYNDYINQEWTAFGALKITGVKSTGSGTTWTTVTLTNSNPNLFVYITVKVN